MIATLNRVTSVIRLVVALLPWVASMYLLYRLDKDQIWAIDTPFRDLMTIGILVSGMGLSFLLHSYFARRPIQGKSRQSPQ